MNKAIEFYLENPPNAAGPGGAGRSHQRSPSPGGDLLDFEGYEVQRPPHFQPQQHQTPALDAFGGVDMQMFGRPGSLEHEAFQGQGMDEDEQLQQALAVSMGERASLFLGRTDTVVVMYVVCMQQLPAPSMQTLVRHQTTES